MPEQTQPQGAVSQEAPGSVEFAVQQLMQSEDPAEAPQETQAPVQSEQQATEQSPAEDAEPSPDDIPDEQPVEQPAVDEFALEIVHDGHQVTLNREDTIKYARQGYDYTQKTQAVAAKDRQVSEQLQRLAQIEQVAPKLQANLAEVQALGSQLQQWQNVNWVQVAQTDPNYAVLRAQYDQLRESYGAALQRYQQADGVVKQELMRIQAQRLQAEAQRLPELVPEWKDPAKLESAKTDIGRHFSTSYGIDPQELNAEANTALKVAILYKAMRYDQLVRSKADKSKTLRKAPPVTVPGAAQTTPAKAERLKQAETKLRKSGTMEDAVAVLLNR